MSQQKPDIPDNGKHTYAITYILLSVSLCFYGSSSVPEIIDPVFAKTSQNARFLLSEYERFGLVFTKTRVYKFGHCAIRRTEEIYRYITPEKLSVSFTITVLKLQRTYM